MRIENTSTLDFLLQVSFPDGKFFTEPDGRFLCEHDYQQTREKCDHCKLPLLDRVGQDSQNITNYVYFFKITLKSWSGFDCNGAKVPSSLLPLRTLRHRSRRSSIPHLGRIRECCTELILLFSMLFFSFTYPLLI